MERRKELTSFFSHFGQPFFFHFSHNLNLLPNHPPTHKKKQRALAPDAPPDWTLDQIAGLVFGVRKKRAEVLFSRKFP